VETYSDFTGDNNPWGERDFGDFEEGGVSIFWKIEYCDLDYELHSEDPSNPRVTRRVLTIMLKEEY
jgi:hypothetical protein